jgi:hypothetical protein
MRQLEPFKTGPINLTFFLLQIVLLDAEEVQIVALKSILDLLQVYGLDTFKVTPAEQAIIEAEESLLEPENDVSDDDSDDVSDDENLGDKDGHDSDRVSDKDEGDGVEEKDKIMEEAQKSVSSVFSVLIKLLERDVCHIFPLHLFTIITGLLIYFLQQDTVIRNTAAEGFAKLLLSGRVHSPKLFSRLLLLWYNPLTEDDIYLRDCIGVFLTSFAHGCR